MEHLAYCDKKAKELEKILSGSKTMLIRGAAGRKLPYGRVSIGETIYLIENDGKGLIAAKGIVSTVFNSEKLTEEESKAIIYDNQNKLQLTEAQLKRWIGKKYLCFVEIDDVETIEPFTYARAGNMDDWIIVNSIDEIKKEIKK
jgi:hypothetical protein